MKILFFKSGILAFVLYFKQVIQELETYENVCRFLNLHFLFCTAEEN